MDPHTFHSDRAPLSALVSGSTTWERALVPIAPAVRLTAFAVSGLLGVALVLQLTVLDDVAMAGTAEYFLFGWTWLEALLAVHAYLVVPYGVLLALLVATAVLTEGFAIAGRRLQRVLAGLVIVGLVVLLPALGMAVLALANMIAWVVIVVLVAALLIGAMIAAIANG
jgi:hypothetical protein